MTETRNGQMIDDRTWASVTNFICGSDDTLLSACDFTHRYSRCDSHGGVEVTCTDLTPTDAPTDTERPTTAVPSTAYRRTSEVATTQGQTTPRVAVTTVKDEKEETTEREVVTSDLTTGESAQTSPLTIETRAGGATDSKLTRSPSEKDGTTTESSAGDGGFDTRNGSNAGTYIGLAIGCVLIVVCAIVVVVCLLKRHKRQDKETTATLRPSVGFQQHSVVYENSQGPNHLMMQDLGQAVPDSADDSAEYTYCAVGERVNTESSVRYATGAVGERAEPGYTAPNPSPVKKPREHLVLSEQKPGRKVAGNVAIPSYLELDGGVAPEDGAESDNSYYFKLQPGSPDPVTPERVHGGTDYFTVEAGGVLVDNGQYTTGDDVDDHYYSFAKLETTTTSDPQEDDVYAYPDAPTEGANKPPNADYSMIEEGSNSTGSPPYKASEKGCVHPEMESEYAYVDTSQRYDESTGETEGWVENIAYASFP
ncbi:uncharacterized protein LOC119731961 [Patiria miniata]|uniref:Uncharacterized protein n=1 Tax=Patiria miniata TaxID=46514 RepID=A0A914ABV7_PATMI|nr:uncharacterized protein LOC119731961 [Patiria miniata]